MIPLSLVFTWFLKCINYYFVLLYYLIENQFIMMNV